MLRSRFPVVQYQYRILIADDAPVIRLMARSLLVELGVQEANILEAGKGTDVLNIVREQDTQIVFLDVDLPGMDGTEVLKQLTEYDPYLKVVILTALSTADPRVLHMLSQGAFDYIQKPLRKEHLSRILTLAWEESRGAGRVH